MTVYIEYALIENFLYDYALLRLAFFTAREETKRIKLFSSALLGAIFALLFPLLRLPKGFGLPLKIGVGCLLCLLSFGRLKTKKEWGRYAFTTFCFFAFTFAFGGALQSFSDGERRSPTLIAIVVAYLTCSFAFAVKKFYQKRAIHTFVYPCQVSNGEKRIKTFGFYDSGNQATRKGAPIYFLSPDLFYDLYGEEMIKGRGTVCDETEINTVNGVKKTRLYQGEIAVEISHGQIRRCAVYFAPSPNMISREYKVLLNATIIGE